MRLKDFTKNDKPAMNALGFASKAELGAFVNEYNLNGKDVTKGQLLVRIRKQQKENKKAKTKNAKKNKKVVDKYLEKDAIGIDADNEPIVVKRNYGIAQDEKKKNEKYVFNCDITVKYSYGFYNNNKGNESERHEDTESTFFRKVFFTTKPTDEQLKEHIKSIGRSYFNSIRSATVDSWDGMGLRLTLQDVSFEGIDNSRVFNKYKKITQMPMLKVSPTLYKRLHAEVNNPKEEGQCVSEYIIKHLTTGKKCIKEATVRKVIKKVMDEYELDDMDGFTIEQLQSVLDVFKVSHYALDFTKKVVHKKTFHPSHYEPVMYFILSNHLYPITDKKYRLSILQAERAKSNESIDLSKSRFESMEEKRNELAERLEKLKMVEILEETIDEKELERKVKHIKDEKERKLEANKIRKVMENEELLKRIKKLSDCNVFINRPCLRSFLLYVFNTEDTEFLFRNGSGKVSAMDYDNNVKLFANPNYNITRSEEQKDGTKIRVKLDWNDSKEVCKLANIKFINQNIQMISNEVYQTYYNEKGDSKHQRRAIGQKERKEVWMNQKKTCNLCHNKCDKYEIDHVTALWKKGTNDKTNLQALCVPCHKLKTSLEAAERVFDADNTKSDFNDVTQKIFNATKNAFRHTTFETYEEMDKMYQDIKDEKVYEFGLDINKCRKFLLRYGKGDFCVFSVLDDVKNFNKLCDKIVTGFYYVKSDNLFPLKGNGWYDHVLVDYCIKKKIITMDQIVYKLIPSLTLPATFFNKFIDYVDATFPPKYAKHMINAGLVGMMGVKSSTRHKVLLTKSLEQAATLKFDDHGENDKNVFVIPYDGFYECLEITNTDFMSGHTPIFNAILDREVMELHKLTNIIKKDAKEIVYYNTDNAIAIYKNKASIERLTKQSKNYYWNDEKTIEKYKIEASLFKKAVCHEIADTYDALYDTMPKYNTIEEINDTNKMVDYLYDMNKSFQLDGMGGCGKTTLINAFIQKLQKEDKKYVVLAPTHKALTELKTDKEQKATLHKFVNVHMDAKVSAEKSKKKNTLNKVYDYIIIDEKSMVGEQFIKYLYMYKKKYPTVKFIYSGDYRQIGPVCDRVDTFDYKNSMAVYTLCDGNILEMKTFRRGDKALYNLLCSDIDSIDSSQFGQRAHKKSLAYTNAKRIAVNSYWMDKEKKEGKYITISRNQHNKNSQDMYVYKDLPVIACRTNKGLDFVNSDSGKIIGYDKTHITIALDGKEDVLKLEHGVFKVSFYPAYCITIHRSQGCSIDEPYTIYDWNKLNTQLKYVALSRSRKLSYINIVN